MAETEQVQALSSVHLLLPEALERRLERWTERMPGASWPAWGGHVTLVPNFIPRCTMDELRTTLDAVCTEIQPFAVRLAAPVSVKDKTRPDYCAVFLNVEDQDEERRPLHELRRKLLDALEFLRDDVLPELLEQPFMPHVTLALGLGEAEAVRLVNAIRADPIEAEFRVEAVWLVTQARTEGTRGEGRRFDRHPVPLGGIARAELFRD